MVKENPIWRILARDQSLLDDYVDAAFSQFEWYDGLGTDDGMRVEIPSRTGPIKSLSRVMSLWYMGGILSPVRSFISGFESLQGRVLGNRNAQLVGIKPEEHST